MEALVILLGQFLFPICCGILLLLFEAVLLLAFSLARPVGLLLGSLPSASLIARSMAMRVVRLILLIGVAATLVSGWLLNTVFFEPVLHRLAERVGNRSGIQIAFKEASGSFVPGRIMLHEVTVQRAGRSEANYDIGISKINVDFNLFRFLSSIVPINQLEVDGVKGEIALSRSTSGGGNEPKTRGLKSRRRFRIETLRVVDVNVVVSDIADADDPVHLPVVIHDLEVMPLRSRFAVFDFLFRAVGNGTVAEQPFRVHTAVISGGRSTEWTAGNLPVSTLSRFVGGPFRYFVEGEIDVDVQDSWRMESSTEIDMHWNLTLRNAVAAVPKDVGAWEKALAGPVTAYINGQDGPLELSVDFTMNERDFSGACSLHAAGLWDRFASAFMTEMAQRLGIDRSGVEGAVNTGLDRFRSFLDDKRKPADQRKNENETL